MSDEQATTTTSAPTTKVGDRVFNGEKLGTIEKITGTLAYVGYDDGSGKWEGLSALTTSAVVLHRAEPDGEVAYLHSLIAQWAAMLDGAVAELHAAGSDASDVVRVQAQMRAAAGRGGDA